MSADSAMGASSVVVAAAALLGALEDLANRREYTDAGLMSWRIADLMAPKARRAGVERTRTLVFSYPSFLAVLAMRALASLGLFGAVHHSPDRASAAVACLVSLLGIVYKLARSPYGADGADQMLIVVFAGLTVAWASAPGSETEMAALLFVSAQLTLAYTVAGVAKIISPLWWNGSGLAGVLGTRNYGTVTLARVYGRHKALAVASSIAVIAFETTFVLAWLLPPQAVAAYLSIGVVFHIGVAVMMGLNTFLFAFLAAYPVTWYCMTVLT